MSGAVLNLVLAGGVEAAAICGLSPVPDGVRARGCAGTAEWTIAAPPASVAVHGGRGGVFRGLAVDVMVSDGDFLWLGVSDGRSAAVQPRGLIRHDWRRDVSHAFRGTDAGPCGFRVQDLLLRDDTLWVATDLGVSRLRLSREDWDEWTHYALDDGRTRLEETACAGILAGAAEASARPGGEDLARWLAEFRPRFWKRYRRGTHPASH